MLKPLIEPNVSTVKAADFPQLEESEEKLRFLLNYAVLAPSSHNTQPWLWEITGNEISLRVDRSREMPALDASGRELILSCGAALQHLRLAIRASGYSEVISILPERAQPDLLARVQLCQMRQPSPDDALLFSYIAQRHTNRQQFEDRELPAELLQALQQEAVHERATLHLVQGQAQRDEIIKLIEYGALTQSSDPATRRDQADWMTPTHSERRDGIPTRALGISDWISRVAPFAIRILDRGETQADQQGHLAGNAPVLAVLCTDDDGPQDWLAAGQALSRVLLRARAEGVWASFFSQPVQVDEAWVQLRHVLGIRNFPQLVFRLGYAESGSDLVPSTPRRSVDEVSKVL
jgi:hypothetical protein